MEKNLPQGTSMITMIKMDEDDKRRDQRRCAFFRKKYKDQEKYCCKNYSRCIGSAHCIDYLEQEQEDKKSNAPRQSVAKLVPTEKKKMSDHEGLKRFPKGCRIRHAKYGSGMIREISEGRIEILFDSGQFMKFGLDTCVEQNLLAKEQSI